MRREVILIVSVILLIGSSCHRHTEYPASMLQAVELMDVQPDSALKLLHTVDSVIHSYDEEARYYHRLLTIQAEDKCNYIHPSTGPINEIIAYYEKLPNQKAKQSLAYYYKGRVNADLNKTEDAIKAYRQAIALTQLTYDNKLAGLCYNQLYYIYIDADLCKDAHEAILQALKQFELSGETYHLPYAIRDIARVFSLTNQKDSASYYYEKSLRVAVNNKDTLHYNRILGEYGCHLYDIGSVDKAYILLHQALQMNPNKINIYNKLALYHFNKQCLDSAYYYTNKLMEEGDNLAKENAYYTLYKIAKSEGHENLALNYYIKFLELGNEIENSKNREDIINLKVQFEQEHSRAQLEQLKRKAVQRNFFILFIVIAFAIVCFYIYKYLFKKLQYLKEEKLLSEKSYQDEINRINRDVDELQKNLSTLKEKKAHVHNMTVLMNNPIYKGLFESKSYRMYNNSNISWLEWDMQFEQAFPGFYAKLKAMYSEISSEELHICSLEKLGMSNVDMSIVFCIQPSAMSNRRSRLLKNLDPSGTYKKFNSFIKGL